MRSVLITEFPLRFSSHGAVKLQCWQFLILSTLTKPSPCPIGPCPKKLHGTASEHQTWPLRQDSKHGTHQAENTHHVPGATAAAHGGRCLGAFDEAPCDELRRPAGRGVARRRRERAGRGTERRQGQGAGPLQGQAEEDASEEARREEDGWYVWARAHCCHRLFREMYG